MSIKGLIYKTPENKVIIRNDLILMNEPTIDFLLIGAGGNGGYAGPHCCFGGGGGGGAGGYIFRTNIKILTGSTLYPYSLEFPVIVGIGNTSYISGNTMFSGYTAYKGGDGGYNPNVSYAQIVYAAYDGGNGGCGGGGGAGFQNWTNGRITNGGIGSQGFNGSVSSSSYHGYGGGGGGIGENGQAEEGGDGLQFPIFGTDYFGGGGGAGSLTSTWIHRGGLGGGGCGDTNQGPCIKNGTPNTGGGGGGGFYGYPAGEGGSGVAKFRIEADLFPNSSGGDITYDGIYKIHTFTSSGTLIL
jgi:hypothetical protein